MSIEVKIIKPELNSFAYCFFCLKRIETEYLKINSPINEFLLHLTCIHSFIQRIYKTESEHIEKNSIKTESLYGNIYLDNALNELSRRHVTIEPNRTATGELDTTDIFNNISVVQTTDNAWVNTDRVDRTNQSVSTRIRRRT